MKIAKDMLLENWNLKLTALFLAVVLWLAVHGDPGAERNIIVPLEIRNIPPNTEITNERPSFVDVTIRGSISNLGFGQPVLTCVVDLQNAEEGERHIPLTSENVRIPRTSSLEVISVRPARITIVLERTLSKEVPIVTPREGMPAPGFEIYSITRSPSTTLITGPRSRVERIKEVSTEAISLEGTRETIRTFVNLNITDNRIHSSSVAPVEVIVEIGVQRRLQTVTQVPVVPDDTSLTVIPPSVAVLVMVPATFKGRLSREDIAASVSARNLDPTSTVERVKPEISFTGQPDPALSVKEVIPPRVTVRRGGKR